jgi:hypothetical protein
MMIPVAFTDSSGVRHAIMPNVAAAPAGPAISADLAEDRILRARAQAAEAGQQPLSFEPAAPPPASVAAAPIAVPPLTPITIVRTAPATAAPVAIDAPGPMLAQPTEREKATPNQHPTDRHEQRLAKHRGHHQD